jgi:hypothetical protein
VLLLVGTHRNENAGTNNSIELQITAGGNKVVSKEIEDTTQTDRKRGSFNWYPIGQYDVIPFTHNDVLSNGGITQNILGTDAWLPSKVFVFGFDTPDGRPTEIVTLVSIRDWTMGWLSTDSREDEDQGTKNLPVSTVQ